MNTYTGSRPPDRDPLTIENRKVPIRKANTAYRSREYLLEKEVAALIEAAAGVGRHGTRDAALILIAYRHGLRVSALVSLRWDQVDLRQGLLHVTRLIPPPTNQYAFAQSRIPVDMMVHGRAASLFHAWAQ